MDLNLDQQLGEVRDDVWRWCARWDHAVPFCLLRLVPLFIFHVSGQRFCEKKKRLSIVMILEFLKLLEEPIISGVLFEIPDAFYQA